MHYLTARRSRLRGKGPLPGGSEFALLDQGLETVGQRSAMDRDVAVMTDNERLPPPARHDLLPERRRSSPGNFEALQLSHMVNVHPVVRSADLTPVRKEAGNKLAPRAGVMALERAVLDGGERVGLERHVAEYGLVVRTAVRFGLGGFEDALDDTLPRHVGGGVFAPHRLGCRLVSPR